MGRKRKLTARKSVSSKTVSNQLDIDSTVDCETLVKNDQHSRTESEKFGKQTTTKESNVNYQYAIDDIMLSQQDGTGEVGWMCKLYDDNQGQSSGKADIEELVKAFAVGQRGENRAPATPPLLRSWLESPSQEQEERPRRGVTRAGTRVQRQKRGRTSTVERNVEGKELLQKLAALYEKQDQGLSPDPVEEIISKRSRLDEELPGDHSKQDSSDCSLETDHNASMRDMFEPTQKPGSTTSTQAFPGVLPEISCVSPIVPKKGDYCNGPLQIMEAPSPIILKKCKSAQVLNGSPSNDTTCMSPVIQKTLLSTPIGVKRDGQRITTPGSAKRSANQSNDDLWTDEEMFENDSFLAMTQNVANHCGLASPFGVDKGRRLSFGDKRSPITPNAKSIRTGNQSTYKYLRNNDKTVASHKELFKAPAPVSNAKQLAVLPKPNQEQNQSTHSEAVDTMARQTSGILSGNNAINKDDRYEQQTTLVSGINRAGNYFTRAHTFVSGAKSTNINIITSSMASTKASTLKTQPSKTATTVTLSSRNSTITSYSASKSPQKTVLRNSRPLLSPLKAKTYSISSKRTSTKSLDSNENLKDNSSVSKMSSIKDKSSNNKNQISHSIQSNNRTCLMQNKSSTIATVAVSDSKLYFTPKTVASNSAAKSVVSVDNPKLAEFATDTITSADTSLSEELLCALAEPDDMLDTQASLFDDSFGNWEVTDALQDKDKLLSNVKSITKQNKDQPFEEELSTQALLDYPAEDDSLCNDFMATQQLFDMLDQVETSVLKEQNMGPRDASSLNLHNSEQTKLVTVPSNKGQALKEVSVATRQKLQQSPQKKCSISNVGTVKSTEQSSFTAKSETRPEITTGISRRFSFKPSSGEQNIPSVNISPKKAGFQPVQRESSVPSSGARPKPQNLSSKLQKFPSFDTLNTHASPRAVVDGHLSSSQDSPNCKTKSQYSNKQIEQKRKEAIQRRKNRLKLSKK